MIPIVWFWDGERLRSPLSYYTERNLGPGDPGHIASLSGDSEADIIRALGYREYPAAVLGYHPQLDDGPGLGYYERRPDSSAFYAYLVLLVLGEQVEYVFVRDTPDLIELLRRYGPVIGQLGTSGGGCNCDR